ncbi:MAG: SMC-Scp complex subunit ScpB [Planctomycetota bacterium]|nr:SMC-Scp complex subunit ScpB [Planctomycetota bacterium]
MDEITRTTPVDADSLQSKAQRTKGPAELSGREGAVDVLAEDDEVTRVAEHWDGDPDESGRSPSGDHEGSDPRDQDQHSDSPVEDSDAAERSPGDGESDQVEAQEAKAAVDAAAGALEVEEEVPADDREGLPEVPELASPEEIARIVFVLVLTQREGLSLFRLAQACNCTQKQIEEAIGLLAGQIEESGMPVELSRTGDTFKLLSGPETFPFLQRLKGVKKLEKLSPAALETLAVVAYRQPVIRAEIEAIRGVKAGPMLRTLLSHKLVRVTGRADVPGRPLQYGTTQRFLDRFGLASLQELPSIKEFKNLG